MKTWVILILVQQVVLLDSRLKFFYVVQVGLNKNQVLQNLDLTIGGEVLLMEMIRMIKK